MSIIRPFISIPRNLAEWDRFFRQATVGDNEITNKKLRDSVGTSVIGRSAATAGDPGDIQSTADGEFLVRRSSVLGFGGIVDADIPATIKRKYTVEAITASQTAEANKVYLVDATAGPLTVALPTGSQNDSLHVKKTDASSNAVTISGTIDGYASVVINLRYQSYHLVHDGTQWWIV